MGPAPAPREAAPPERLRPQRALTWGPRIALGLGLPFLQLHGQPKVGNADVAWRANTAQVTYSPTNRGPQSSWSRGSLGQLCTHTHTRHACVHKHSTGTHRRPHSSPWTDGGAQQRLPGVRGTGPQPASSLSSAALACGDSGCPSASDGEGTLKSLAGGLGLGSCFVIRCPV